MRENFKKAVVINFFLLIFISCTQIAKTGNEVSEVFTGDDFADSIVSTVVPKWYTGNSNFILKQSSGDISPHMFFDVDPDIDLDKKTINFLVTTPQDSSHEYSLDILTGRHFLNKAYCEQSDIWKHYDETIERPPYTAGAIPRVLDQLGKPQKIIVFGENDTYDKNYTENLFDARIVGGFIEQVCPKGGCHGRGDWSSRIVLVGVQPENEKYENIKDLEALKTVVEWSKVKAFVENGQGNNHISGSYFPAFRLGAEVSVRQALSYFDRNSIYLKEKKMKGVQQSCHRLYDHIWNKVAKDSKYENSLKQIKSNTKRQTFIKDNKTSSNSFFFSRFKKSFKKYESEYKTCLKYVYPSNVNKDSERHWFFAHYSAVHLLHDLGYSFSCSNRTWFKNYKLSNGNKILKKENEFKGCGPKSIDIVFEQAIVYLDSLRRQGNGSYRYVDYDKGAYGTHNKLYSWVEVKNKKLRCENKVKQPWIATFPKDIKWKRRKMKIKLNRRGMVIK